ncbi:hypothetical protein TRAPUB_1600 [Trametes pubescens]|uniref:Uncharacterized protein n=1 Tax=Trametes pubescens TaxID=154538 RepID=A0A1M2VJ14_TRAPU|nr:hypothetical protein TRAPUB_1600 [Trametes pubescens]
MFTPPALRPTHSRHPSAPVVVRPSHTPGVFNIAKPAQSCPRPQQLQAQPRAPRASPKKQQRSPQPIHAQAASVEASKAPTTSPAKADQSSPAGDKSTRGRKQNKQLKDAHRRVTSVSPSDAAARRHAHQPSPTRIPTPPQASSAPRAEVPRGKPDVPTSLTDLFATDSIPAQSQKADSKAFASPPKLTSQPSGKLARRRQVTAQMLDSPTPKLASRRKERPARAPRSGENAASLQPAFLSNIRPPARRASTDMTMTRVTSFPICDDSSDFGDDSDITPPTTPIREVSTVPAKVTWQQGFFGDAPRTAPLAPMSGFPFVGQTPCSTPTPAQRRRNHRRVPSEGVFAMSTDEESPSSSTSDLFDTLPAHRRTPVAIPRHRGHVTDPFGGSSPAASLADRHTSSSAPVAVAGYFAGSVFQNSPSPDDLPAPSFAV